MTPRTVLAWLASALFALALALAPAGASAGEDVSREDRLKAAFLLNFAKFIEWPSASFAHEQSPFVVGVLGDAAFALALEEASRDRRVNGRAVVVKRVLGQPDMASTHALFVGTKDERQLSQLWPLLATAPVLTVGESATFARMGGTINFLVHGDKLRFEINMAAAERNGFKVSAQLQKLAAAIRREP